MPERLDGAVAIVTGASSGIGRAAALRLARVGASVVVVARRRGHLDEVASAITAAGETALLLEADITVGGQAAAVVDAATGRFGRLDTVVNAAGLMLNVPTLSLPVEDWERIIDINVKGLMYVTKAALPRLLIAAKDGARGVADVVNIGSVAGRVANATVAIYNATKFGVTAATEAWRQEFTGQNVRFSVIGPGAVDTELFGHQSQQTQERYQKMFAGVEKLRADDIADAIAYIVTSPRRVAINEIVIGPTDP